jgi:arginine utilization protein RocB
MGGQVWAERVRALTEQLVSIPSVNGTAGEVGFPDLLHRLLARSPAFRDHPERLRLLPIEGDPVGRSNLAAWVPGSGAETPGGGRRTVVLTGHFDVVTTSNLGVLGPYAFDPPHLAEAAERLLREEADAGQPDPVAESDLASGDWLFGRGALDMKCGLAAGIAVLERAAAKPAGGGLLLLATPDEEASSVGMRAAVTALAGLAREWDLEPVAALNLDISEDPGDGSTGRAVFLGSVGKLLPFVHLVGREVHAGMPTAGLNAALLAAEVTRHVELNPDLVDASGGEVAPAPVTLHQTDGRRGYDVTTPRTAWCYYNLLRYAGSAAAAFEAFTEVVRAAVAEAARLTHQRALVHARRSGSEAPPRWEPQVLTFAQLRERAGDAAPACEAAAEGAPDLPERARRVTEALWEASGLRGPAAVVGLAGVPYAPVHLGEGHRDRRLREAVERQAAAVGAEHGTSITLRPWFAGISDMSFLAADQPPADEELLARNTPGWGTAIHIDTAAARELALPVVNVGAWGRGAHGRLERVFGPYAFETVPELVWRIATDVLRDET